MPSPTLPARAALVLAAATIAAACAGGDDVSSVTTPATPVPLVTTTLAEQPVDETTAPSTTEAPPESTTGPVVTTTTVPPSTTTTTTEPVAVQELLLRADGLGSARFGAAPEGVIEYVTSILGGNTGDTGWVDPQSFALCDGDIARRVDWGVLSLLFSDLSDVANGRRHFMGYEYGRVGEIGDEPSDLRTPGGTTLGSRVVDLLAEFPEAAINEGEDDIDIPPNFYVSNNFRGLMTGVAPDDVVTVIFGGYGCGE